jgi:hypothetical protein
MPSSARDCLVTKNEHSMVVSIVIGLCDVVISDYNVTNWKRYRRKVPELNSGTSLLYATKD